MPHRIIAVGDQELPEGTDWAVVRRYARVRVFVKESATPRAVAEALAVADREQRRGTVPIRRGLSGLALTLIGLEVAAHAGVEALVTRAV